MCRACHVLPRCVDFLLGQRGICPGETGVRGTVFLRDGAPLCTSFIFTVNIQVDWDVPCLSSCQKDQAGVFDIEDKCKGSFGMVCFVFAFKELFLIMQVMFEYIFVIKIHMTPTE